MYSSVLQNLSDVKLQLFLVTMQYKKMAYSC